MKMSKYQSDALERIMWTAIQAALAVLFVHVAELPAEWMVPAAATLSALKSIVARKIGDAESAALMPSWVETAVTETTTDVVETAVKKAKRASRNA